MHTERDGKVLYSHFFMPPMEICLAPKATGEAFCMTLCAAQWHRDPFSPAGLVGTCPLKSISPLVWANPFNRNNKSGGGTGWECHLNISQDPSPFFLFKRNKQTNKDTAVAEQLTLDDEFPVLVARVLHGVKGLLGDAVEVHVPPVLQHLESDVCAVDHCSRCL